MSSRRNWDSPTPSLNSECAHPHEPRGGGGGAHSPAGKVLGESQFGRLEKSLALCLLCGEHCLLCGDTIRHQCLGFVFLLSLPAALLFHLSWCTNRIVWPGPRNSKRLSVTYGSFQADSQTLMYQMYQVVTVSVSIPPPLATIPLPLSKASSHNQLFSPVCSTRGPVTMWVQIALHLCSKGGIPVNTEDSTLTLRCILTFANIVFTCHLWWLSQLVWLSAGTTSN